MAKQNSTNEISKTKIVPSRLASQRTVIRGLLLETAGYYNEDRPGEMNEAADRLVHEVLIYRDWLNGKE